MAMEKQWMEDEVVLGTYGRVSGKRVESFADCDDEAGLYRGEGTEAMHEAKKYLINQMRGVGLEVYYDEVGNLYGRRAGKKDCKAVATGSHMDTVGNGGQLDEARRNRRLCASHI